MFEEEQSTEKWPPVVFMQLAFLDFSQMKMQQL
jgi:hypothetical protein